MAEEHASHQDWVEFAKYRIGETAQFMLDGKLTCRDGIPKLVTLIHAASLDLDDSITDTLAGIASEGDELPTSDTNHLWPEEALGEKASEIAEFERWALKTGYSCYKYLAQRYTRPRN